MGHAFGRHLGRYGSRLWPPCRSERSAPFELFRLQWGGPSLEPATFILNANSGLLRVPPHPLPVRILVMSFFRSQPHPFYPPSLPLANYHAMTIPAGAIFAVFGASVLLIVGVLVRLSSHLPLASRIIATWLAVTGAIHLVIEGYVVVTPDYYQHPADNYLSEAWKEYTKADSRYASRDSFVISMEAVTAFLVGPLCFVATHGILKNRPWRWVLSLVVSVCQVYGDVLYYGTCFLEGFVHSRPEPLYFWVYFVLLNALWVVIPACVGVHSWRELTRSAGGSRSKGKRS